MQSLHKYQYHRPFLDKYLPVRSRAKNPKTFNINGKSPVNEQPRNTEKTQSFSRSSNSVTVPGLT